VLERLSQELAGTPTCTVLANSQCWILWRRTGDHGLVAQLDRIAAMPGALLSEDVAGTNGLGTVAELRRPLLVAGSEHYMDNMQDFTCVGVPIRHPISKRLEGILDITCFYPDTNGLLMPLVTQNARDIEQRLYEGSSASERVLFDEFVKQTRRSSQAVICLNNEFIFANAPALQLLDPADHALLWDWAKRAAATGREITDDVRLTRGIPVTARCAPVSDGPEVMGVLITMVADQAAGPMGRPRASLAAGSGSRRWQRVLRQVQVLATTRASALFRGEPGTGRTDLCRLVHAGSNGGNGSGEPAVFDCGAAEVDAEAWMAGLRCAFEEERVTVVLRDVEALPSPLVAEVASLAETKADCPRVLMTGRSDVTDDDRLARLVDQIDVVVDVPPLRLRAEDIAELTRRFITEAMGNRPPARVTPDALALLVRYDWPRNVSELRQVVGTALVNSRYRDITAQDLPGAFWASRSKRALAGLERTERDAIVGALQNAGWNKTDAAADLGISRATLYRKMKAFNLQ
jgi:transcriptional regulator of acetoin/glycerol metabolism